MTTSTLSADWAPARLATSSNSAVSQRRVFMARLPTERGQRLPGLLGIRELRVQREGRLQRLSRAVEDAGLLIRQPEVVVDHRILGVDLDRRLELAQRLR